MNERIAGTDPNGAWIADTGRAIPAENEKGYHTSDRAGTPVAGLKSKWETAEEDMNGNDVWKVL